MDQGLVLPILALDEDVVLPGMVVPLDLSDADVRTAVDAARAATDDRVPGSGIRSTTPESAKAAILMVPRQDGRYGSIGTVGVIEQVGRMPKGRAVAVVRGSKRVRVGAATTGPGAALWVAATELPDVEPTEDITELVREYKGVLSAILQQRGAWQMVDSVQQVEDPSGLADLAGYAPYLSTAQKVTLLETADVAERVRQALAWAREHLAELDVSETIRKDVAEGMERQQREFLLRQQLAAIRKELAELDGKPASEEQDYRARVEAAELPEKVRTAALSEVDKLERTSDQSPEVGWIRTWLDTVLDMPWNVRTEDAYDIAGARAILDADHSGLSDVKDRIVEYLAVRKRRADKGLKVVGGRRSGAVLALVGPPGVGKTSLGESVARAMGRKFVRVALGGVRDEAEIRGHRRTYVGALPGRIVRAIGEAGSMNPVVLLDEIDKVGADYRGDPTAALLEVLDPAQNHTFRDHYLDLDLDLSDVVFLATANVIENIPSALLDRMELVQIDGYTEDDKVAIARDFLLPRQRDRAALTAEEVAVTEDALRKIAADYTREPGVRQFERLLAKALRKATTKLAEDSAALTIDEPDLVAYLGRPRFTPESAERTAVPGVATGLAVTGLGGDVLYIEAGATDGEAGLQLTGQLGDVMKESAQIALSYVRSHAGELGVDPKALDRRIHVHVPAGAVPKDGPSAGVTMVTALVSMATGRQVRSDVGMTGEVTLNGRVLPIGGVKQKLLAAQRAGLSTVFIPQRNEPDLDDVPAEVLESLEVKPMTDVADIVAQALEPAAEGATVAA